MIRSSRRNGGGGLNANRRNNSLKNNRNNSRPNRLNNRMNRMSSNYDDSYGGTPSDNNILEENDSSQNINNSFNGMKNNISSQTSSKNVSSINSSGGTLDSEEDDGKVKFKISKSLKVKIILVGLIILAVVSLILFIIVLIVATLGGGDVSSVATDDEIMCKSITVKQCERVPDDYVLKDSESWCEGGEAGHYVLKELIPDVPLEDYVAGVVAGEVGDLPNVEVYKAFAIAARTYVLGNIDSGCTIESSNRRQVYNSTSNKKIINAVAETKNRLIYADSGELLSVSYDMFACGGKITNDDGVEYYIVNQPVLEHQYVPVSFVESNKGKFREEWLDCNKSEHHGRGMSQFGAYYLAEEKGYDHYELLYYYYKDYITGRVTQDLFNCNSIFEIDREKCLSSYQNS